MYGLSVFLGEDLTSDTIIYIKKMKKIGFNGIFSSLHIPEEDATLYFNRLQELGGIAKTENMKLMVDISGEALNRANLSFDRLEELLDLGVTGLRMDYEISNQTIAKASQMMDIGLNASTLTEEDIRELQEFGADFSRFEAWHNYYPRPETGLSNCFLIEKNQWLKAVGLRVFAFVSGDERLRGPLFEELPTLESHRYVNPFAAAFDLLENFFVDAVYIGDPSISERTMRQFDFFQKEKRLPIEIEDCDSRHFDYVLGDHKNRQDDARDVVRSADARFREIPQIAPENIGERRKGSVTIDNEKYGRYMGELQVAKRNLPKNEKINIVATVSKKDLPLVDLIKAGQEFTLLKKGTL